MSGRRIGGKGGFDVGARAVAKPRAHFVRLVHDGADVVTCRHYVAANSKRFPAGEIANLLPTRQWGEGGRTA